MLNRERECVLCVNERASEEQIKRQAENRRRGARIVFWYEGRWRRWRKKKSENDDKRTSARGEERDDDYEETNDDDGQWWWWLCCFCGFAMMVVYIVWLLLLLFFVHYTKYLQFPKVIRASSLNKSSGAVESRKANSMLLFWFPHNRRFFSH